jgi:hypothetical protein
MADVNWHVAKTLNSALDLDRPQRRGERLQLGWELAKTVGVTVICYWMDKIIYLSESNGMRRRRALRGIRVRTRGGIRKVPGPDDVPMLQWFTRFSKRYITWSGVFAVTFSVDRPTFMWLHVFLVIITDPIGSVRPLLFS